jgi:hypothetical protein
MSLEALNNLEGALNQNIGLHKQTIKNIANINSDNYIKSFPDTLSDAEKQIRKKAELDQELNSLSEKSLRIETLMRIWTMKYQDLRKVSTLGKG